MSKQEAKGIAAGLLFAAILLTAYYFMFSNVTAEEGNQSTEAAIETHLEENGMIMIKREKYEALKADKEQKAANEPIEESSDTSEEADQEEESTPEKTSFNIKEGMTSQEVAQSLQDQKLVENADDFIEILQDKGKETAIQPGEYELQTDMTASDIIGVIAR
ncbi:endolytic transglycosylase MltG [Pseudalkalibacillus hwajinpoensis]|uniref:endolytic transglycosylase MltG n=1 Tax=Guptibacillus hwajinpoensis TaxID=208199 RepID=UPI00325AB516